MSKIKHTVLHGGHCEYVGAVDACGDSVLGKLIEDYIKNIAV